MANSPKLRGAYDLLAIVGLTALLTICIVFVSSNVPRIIIGLPSILFFPGYALIAALFPGKESLGAIQRVALSFGLSLAVVPLICLLLNYLWEISLYPILVSIAGFTVMMCALAYFRRSRLVPEQRFEPQINLPTPQWREQSKLDQVLTAILAIVVIGAIVTVIYVAVHPKPGQRFTEFYLLGSSGTAEDYPRDVVLGAEADVIVGIANHEGENATYQVRISMDNTEVQAIDGVALHDGEKWEKTVALTPTKAGDNQEVEFLLYRVGEPKPYHGLHLWINVHDA
jgi:uncharacterized membrane protein